MLGIPRDISRRLAEAYLAFERNILFRLFAITLVCLPAGLLSAVWLGYEVPYATYITESAVSLYFTIFLPPIILIFTSITRLAQAAAAIETNLSYPDLLHFKTVTDNVVGTKRQRFTEAARRQQKETWDAKTTFFQITRPDTGLDTLTTAIHRYFELLKMESRQEVEFNVYLIRMENRRAEKILYNYPKNKPLDLDRTNFRQAEHLIHAPTQHPNVFIVPDINQISSPKGKKEPNKDCSLMCYRILDGQHCPLVLCIEANKCRYFIDSTREKARWEAILSSFEQRFLIEWSLQALKNGCEEYLSSN